MMTIKHAAARASLMAAILTAAGCHKSGAVDQPTTPQAAHVIAAKVQASVNHAKLQGAVARKQQQERGTMNENSPPTDAGPQ